MNAPAQWFHDHNVGVFPLKTRSKEPACKWLGYSCSREHAARFVNYGVRLGTMAVVDPDCHDTIAWCERNLPDTPFLVRTARGFHVYYRLASSDGVPKFLHRDGLTIEFKNAGQYVVGPGSVHPSGAVYTAVEWSWRWDDIPVFPANFLFDDGSCGRRSAPGVIGERYEFPTAGVGKGERHAELFKLLRSLKAQGYEQADARIVIVFANENGCRPPLPDSQIFDNGWFARAWGNPDRPLAEPNPFGDDVWATL